jgi:hypothetical protein
VGPSPGEQHDRLEERGLAGRVRADDQLRAGSEGGLERRIRAEVEDRETTQKGADGRGGGLSDLGAIGRGGAGMRWRVGQDVVLNGMTT